MTSRYSTPPDAAKLEESTRRLEATLDHLERALPSETEFFAALRSRLKDGQVAYGDRSFAREPSQLLGELEQEALDLAGWGYVLWCRVRAARSAAEKAGL